MGIERKKKRRERRLQKHFDFQPSPQSPPPNGVRCPARPPARGVHSGSRPRHQTTATASASHLSAGVSSCANSNPRKPAEGVGHGQVPRIEATPVPAARLHAKKKKKRKEKEKRNEKGLELRRRGQARQVTPPTPPTPPQLASASFFLFSQTGPKVARVCERVISAASRGVRLQLRASGAALCIAGCFRSLRLINFVLLARAEAPTRR